ncbi:hypothetical protein EUGRSUZ_L03699 [Eucalyptus grandis]|uniref:Uncharacterized protein n=1 Tax=Eucalyptus grandis TaxID=71139 RepID=A0AAD9WI16_EUCGR|nr:hypothetical protein EUGRSUZ_L03699 [Eucalyptus grandis]
MHDCSKRHISLFNRLPSKDFTSRIRLTLSLGQILCYLTEVEENRAPQNPSSTRSSESQILHILNMLPPS